MIRDDTSRKFSSKCVVMLGGGLAAGIGILTLVGWHVQSALLVQVNPAFAPMQYNAALGFVFGGVGLMAALFDRRRTALICMSIVTILGGLSLLEYLFGIDLHIDKLLIQPFTTVKTSHAGRMAPNTALCLTLVGASLLISSLCTQSRRRATYLGIMNSLVLSLGLLVFLAYVAGFENPYEWGQLTRMALHTSLSFIALSAAALSLAWLEVGSDPVERMRWLPISGGVAVVVLTLSLWQSQVDQERRRIVVAIQTEVHHLSERIDEGINDRILALIRMAQRWELKGGVPREEWEADAGLYFQHQHGMQSLEWVDSSDRVRWIAPYKGNRSIPNANVAVSGRAAVRPAHDKRRVTVTGPIDLNSGGRGFRVRVPLWVQRKPAGCIQCTMHFRDSVDGAATPTAELGYAIAVFDGDEQIHGRGDSDHTHEADWAQDSHISINDRCWRVRIWPREELLAAMRSPIPKITLVIGLIISCLITIIGHLAKRAAERAQSAEQAEDRFRAVVESSQCAFLTVDGRGHITLVSTQAEAIFGYSREEIIGRPIETLIPEPNREQHQANRASYFRDPQTRPMGWGRELCGQRKDGSRFFVEVALCSIIVDDEMQVLCSIIDITGRIEIERELKDLNHGLEMRTAELERFNLAAVDREHRMIDLKREVNALCKDSGQALRYDLSFIEGDIDAGAPART